MDEDVASRIERLSPEARELFWEVWEVERRGAEADFKIPALELVPDLVARISSLPVGDQAEFFAVFRAIAERSRAERVRFEAGEVEAEGYIKLIERAQELDRLAGRPAKQDMTTGEAVTRLEEAGELDALELGYLRSAMNDLIWVPEPDE
jgi:hypothetical protein